MLSNVSSKKLVSTSSKGGLVFSAWLVPMAAQAAVGYVMPLLNNNCTAREERCLVRGKCRRVVRKTVNEKLVKSWLVS
jgi:hypothetical protein